MNRGGVGARSLNVSLQAALNPAGDRKLEQFGRTFAPKDKVMQIENDYGKEVYNGDIGYVEDVDPEAAELTASFNGRIGPAGKACLDINPKIPTRAKYFLTSIRHSSYRISSRRL